MIVCWQNFVYCQVALATLCTELELTRFQDSGSTVVGPTSPELSTPYQSLWFYANHNDKGVQTTKSGMLKSLKARYTTVEENEYLAIATVSDLHFKDTGESSAPKELSPRRPCTDLRQSFTEILEEAGTGHTDFMSEVEVDKYLSEPLLQFHKSNCHAWWVVNGPISSSRKNSTVLFQCSSYVNPLGAAFLWCSRLLL